VAAAAVLAVVGHCFPVWLGFRGGKGVATGVGVFLGLSPVAVVCSLVVFVIVVWLTRYVSLGSITATVTFPLCLWLLSLYTKPSISLAPVLSAAIMGGAIIIFMHRANIGRLIAGTESRFK
jgi:acyl phosphate:glycerol-3-phosphate acyltransferase